MQNGAKSAHKCKRSKIKCKQRFSHNKTAKPWQAARRATTWCRKASRPVLGARPTRENTRWHTLEGPGWLEGAWPTDVWTRVWSMVAFGVDVAPSVLDFGDENDPISSINRKQSKKQRKKTLGEACSKPVYLIKFVRQRRWYRQKKEEDEYQDGALPLAAIHSNGGA